MKPEKKIETQEGIITYTTDSEFLDRLMEQLRDYVTVFGARGAFMCLTIGKIEEI